eukprot:tig00000169_g11897.t1
MADPFLVSIAIWAGFAWLRSHLNDEAAKQAGLRAREASELRLSNLPQRPELPPLDDEALERHNRTRLFFGEKGFEKIRQSFVVVVGLGGVGSHTAIMLARSGVGRLRLIDYDTVTLSSLNRHACASREDVNQPKATVMGKYVKKSCPEAQVEAVNAMLLPECIDRLLSGRPDYVVDNIDNRETKCLLIAYCQKNGIKLISSMGAGGNCDPTRVRLGDISEAKGLLAKEIRHHLRKSGVTQGVRVVYSTEQSKARLVPQPQARHDPHSAMFRQRFRTGIMPVFGCMPAIFGNACASVLLTDIAGFPMDPETPHSNRESLYIRCMKRLEEKGLIAPGCVARTCAAGENEEPKKPRERKQHLVQNPRWELPHVDLYDVEYMVEKVWRGMSPFSGDRYPLYVTVWDKRRPFGARNCILLHVAEAKEHEAADRLVDRYSPEQIAAVEARLATARDITSRRTLDDEIREAAAAAGGQEIYGGAGR